VVHVMKKVPPCPDTFAVKALLAQPTISVVIYILSPTFFQSLCEEILTGT
jgi:hypothetical protein